MEWTGGDKQMKNEDKILSMLDFIATELKGLKETSITKDEFKSFKEQTYHRFDTIEANIVSIEANILSIEANMVSIENNMVTKDEFRAFVEENKAAHASTNARISEQSKLFEARFDVLNDRLFDQETQLSILKRKEAL